MRVRIQFQIKNSKKAFLASLDLFLTIAIILSLSLPVLMHSTYSSAVIASSSKNIQKISLLLQESQFLYSHGAARHETFFDSQSLLQKNFTFIGHFDEQAFFIYASGAKARSALLGFQTLNYSLLPPASFSSKNQYCVQRKMLDSQKNIVDVWVCAS